MKSSPPVRFAAPASEIQRTRGPHIAVQRGVGSGGGSDYERPILKLVHTDQWFTQMIHELGVAGSRPEERALSLATLGLVPPKAGRRRLEGSGGEESLR